MILSERIHRLLNFCSPAAVPTEWKEQLKYSAVDYFLWCSMSLSHTDVYVEHLRRVQNIMISDPALTL